MSELLRVENLKVTVDGKEILKGLDLVINKGETHVIMGSNGAGKSTLFHSIMGNPSYSVTDGHIFFEGQDITHMPVNERAKLGIFMAFQNPIAVKGISVENLSAMPRVRLREKLNELCLFVKNYVLKWKNCVWISLMRNGM